MGKLVGGVSFVGYDAFLLSLGLYNVEVLGPLKREFKDVGYFGKGRADQGITIVWMR